ncbi:hypothetical protein ON010_g15178 [Phytophthora cinnamomi]|nr:hypothetical protein ON010_g15178 [Phytophthora cinnamomi]
MTRFLIREEKCSIAMTRGVLDMLTIPEHSFIEHGIRLLGLFPEDMGRAVRFDIPNDIADDSDDDASADSELPPDSALDEEGGENEEVL